MVNLGPDGGPLIALLLSLYMHTHFHVHFPESDADIYTQTNSRVNGLTSEPEQSEDFIPLLPTAIQSLQTALHVSIMSEVYTNKSVVLLVLLGKHPFNSREFN